MSCFSYWSGCRTGRRHCRLQPSSGAKAAAARLLGDHFWFLRVGREGNRLPQPRASAYNHRGLAYRHSGGLADAIEDYSAAIAINPVYALAYNNRGYVYEAQGRKEDAIADFKACFFSIRR